MRKLFSLKYIFCFLFLIYGTKNFAQQPRFKLLECKSEVLNGKEKPILFFQNLQYHTVQTDLSFKPINTGKRPMFCKMEDDIHKRFNIWIVLRAGSDADYKKLIGQEK